MPLINTDAERLDVAAMALLRVRLSRRTLLIMPLLNLIFFTFTTLEFSKEDSEVDDDSNDDQNFGRRSREDV